MERVRMGPIGHYQWNHIKWNETRNNVISHINVSFNKNGVTSIQFGYVVNEALVMSQTHGKSSAVCSRRILRLNHESEFVTGISGEVYCGRVSSLTFHTNQRTLEAVHLTLGSGNVGPEKIEFHSGILDRREFFIPYHKLT
ncbi:jacalin-related lectin 24-like [Eutrema salsugineum]|uniref:jacalin-related lectin 24-like n=1 Tax=Eutrema salsugineum TaxID=72664 RepID=UPI000CED28DF|nr:jacalin-related lectin 24-like [Eutrema salsugineum]